MSNEIDQLIVQFDAGVKQPTPKKKVKAFLKHLEVKSISGTEEEKVKSKESRRSKKGSKKSGGASGASK